MTLEVERLAFGLGAAIHGFDPRQPVTPATVAELRRLWLEHKVLVFPQVEMTHAEHIAFSRNFGTLEHHSLLEARHPDHPEIMEVTNRVTDGKPSVTAQTGRQWHTDGAFSTCPPTASLLHCRAIPEVGGDTWFSNMVMAYETLSPRLQQLVDELEVINDLYKHARLRHPTLSEEEARKRMPPVVQPMAWTHPETGRKSLFLSETVTVRIHGMTAAESQGLLSYLFEHCVRPEFTYRHRWRRHDLVMWDNRSTMHLAPADLDPGQLRLMCRTTLVGAPSGRVLDGA